MTIELERLASWLGQPLRNPKQQNGLGQADCEIVALGDGTFLCTTVDMIGEEMRYGLYRDYYTMGWVSAVTSASDLAACCADPIGLLLAVQWSDHENSNEKRQQFMRGFNDVSQRLNLPLLGGDHGHSDTLAIAVTAIGTARQPLLRSGVIPGDELVLMGKIGYGPMMGIGALLELDQQLAEQHYRPLPLSALQYPTKAIDVHAGIDLSDGLLNAVLILSEINQLHFELLWNPQLIQREASAFCERHGLPQILCWIGEHGDYQQLYAMPSASVAALERLEIEHYVIGKANGQLQHTTLTYNNQTLVPDMAWAQLRSTHSFAELMNAAPDFCKQLKAMGYP